MNIGTSARLDAAQPSILQLTAQTGRGWALPLALHVQYRGRRTASKIKSSPATHRPADEESQQPASEQADPKDHSEEGHHSPTQGLEESRRHEVIGGDQKQLMNQHADSMAGHTVTSGGRAPARASVSRLHFADPSRM